MCRYPAGDRPAWIQDTMDTMATMCHRCRAVSCVCIDAGDRAAGWRRGPGRGQSRTRIGNMHYYGTLAAAGATHGGSRPAQGRVTLTTCLPCSLATSSTTPHCTAAWHQPPAGCWMMPDAGNNNNNGIPTIIYPNISK